MSSSGQYVVAGTFSKEIYLSTDSGVSWNLKYTAANGIGNVAISDDGQFVSFCDYGSNCEYSTNGGTSFTALSTGRSIVMSTNGSIQSLFGSSFIQYTSNHWNTSGIATISGSGYYFYAVQLGKTGCYWNPKT